MIAVDTHAHVFHRALAMAPGRRYSPSRDATWEEYLRVLDEHGIGRALLVQPSFLGSDNGYLLSALAARPDRFRGVAVLDVADPRSAARALPSLHAGGVRGVRLNLIGAPVPPLDRPDWRAFADALAELGWHLEVQAEGTQWSSLAPALKTLPGPVVIDHVGLPDEERGPQWKLVLELAAETHVWVKISGFYRSPAGLAAAAAREVRDTAGADRLLWGSDWPWTRFEEGRSYRALLDELREVAGEDTERILGANPARLLDWA